MCGVFFMYNFNAKLSQNQQINDAMGGGGI